MSDPGAGATGKPVSSLGYLALPEQAYELGGEAVRADPAHLFVSVQAKTESDADTPVFVLSAGGPAASAAFLLSGLGPCRLYEVDGQAACAANPNALGELGHVIALDARNAGFSFAEVADASDANLRHSTLGPRNYNVYRDAAETWWALLHAFEQEPLLARHPIYLIAESYGALRTTLMLDMLFEPARYDAGSPASQPAPYRDPALAAALASLGSGAPLNPAWPELSRFCGQLLLEPLLSERLQRKLAGESFEQPGSVLFEIAEETGVPYQPCDPLETACDPFENAQHFLNAANRSPHDYRADAGWILRLTRLVTLGATQRQSLAPLHGVEASAFRELFLTSRERAFRFANLEYGRAIEAGDLIDHFGALEPWDAYFVSQNFEAFTTHYSEPAQALGVSPLGVAAESRWVANLSRIPTLITRARYDLLVYAPELARVLAALPGVRNVQLRGQGDAAECELDLLGGKRVVVDCPEFESSHFVWNEAGPLLLSAIRRFVSKTLR